ncbi:MAG: hypothetical protein IT462_00440 [Planctomycetes bacterium]|nr:hypothetical protein [Planctomycetota bacterium]
MSRLANDPRGRLFGPALLILALAACAGPTARDTEKDTRSEKRAEILKPEIRPRIQPDADDDPKPAEFETLVKALSSPVGLERLKASQRLSRAGVQGVLAAAAYAADPDYGERALRYLATADFAGLKPEQQAEVRKRAIAGLASPTTAIRVAAAEVFQRLGPADYDGEFVNALFDAERAVRWSVVRRYTDNPLELKPVHVVRLAAALGDRKLSTDVRADAMAVLLQQHQKRSEAAKPPTYDPYKDPALQEAEVSAWRAWAATIR